MNSREAGYLTHYPKEENGKIDFRATACGIQFDTEEFAAVTKHIELVSCRECLTKLKSKCPKCGAGLFIESAESEIDYIKIIFTCDNTLKQEASMRPDGTPYLCDYRTTKTVDIGTLLEHSEPEEE